MRGLMLALLLTACEPIEPVALPSCELTDWPEWATYARCRPVIECDYLADDGRNVRYGYAPPSGADYFCEDHREVEP